MSADGTPPPVLREPQDDTGEDIREIEALSSKFEAVKIAMTQDKNGFVLKLVLHPNDAPEDLLRDPVGTRYLIVAVRMNDQDEPVVAPTAREASAVVKIAGALCRDERFQVWLVREELIDEISEKAASEFIRKHCGVNSRSDLRSNKTARDRFLALRDEFADNLRRGISPR